MNLDLESKAIDLALSKEWNKAIKINKKILEKKPCNKKALLRLGQAFVNTKDYEEAQKIFLKVLELDKINKIAKRHIRKIKKKVKVGA